MCQTIGVVLCLYLTIGAAIAGFHYSRTPPEMRFRQAFRGWVRVALFWPAYR
jgi:hypothetical protein